MKQLAVFAVLLLIGLSSARAQSLDAELQRVPTKELAAAARESGDTVRGAVVFFQPHMACSKCHVVGKAAASSLGPDLTKLGKAVTDEALVEAVLLPSKVIRKGFEPVSIVTADGKSLTALLVERTSEKVVVRDVSRGGELTTIAATDIEELKLSTTSIMPAGQMNQLNSRQQFLDLIRYLIEVRDGGEARAMQLQPSAALLAFTVPEYEKHLDHAGLIGEWNGDGLKRGAAIYQRVCANCHGTKDKPGSLPTSLRFAEGKFKNGSDPLSMYRTLTHGFGLMAPQAWMVPSQKYDVIHYVRETYLKPHNSTQFVAVDVAYLARLPKGDTRGPEPSKIEPWSAMDYGPSLAHTFEVPGLEHNIAYKGIAVRLDPGAGGVSRGRHWMIFDTDTLRAAAAWNVAESLRDSESASRSDAATNFIDWKGIQFNGAHGVHPRVVGQTAFANSTGPGWENPRSGEFRDDQRVHGRDGKRYGPLPREWGRFKGLYHHGQQVVFSYTVGTTEILESPRLLSDDMWPSRSATRRRVAEQLGHDTRTNNAQVLDKESPPLFLRTFNIGPRERDLVLQVAEHPAHDAQATVISRADRSVVRFAPPSSESAAPRSQSGPLVAGFSPRNMAAEWTAADGRLRLRIPAGKEPLRFTVWQPADSAELFNRNANGVRANAGAGSTSSAPTPLALGLNELTDQPIPDADRDLTALINGGPPRWPQKLETHAVLGADNGPFATDVLTAPESNPWLAQTRFTGLDFFPDGRIAVCAWDGDVWIVESQPGKADLRWQRIASGLFQPLGLKIVEGKIHVTCRDQLAVLHDLNGDGEIDFYQCLNNDHQVTEHFHEFAMGLQTDAAGNFYYAKSGCHGKAAVVPHHGTLLKVSKDGSRTDILATGFRAANGVCLNPDGSFVVTDQEGFWNPKNRINWVTVPKDGKPNFYGNMLGYHDVTDSSDAAMVPPLCWITNAFDRSPAELLWIESDRWGPLKGSLLNLSYGYGKVFLVPHENVRGTMQGGMIELPLPTFPTGVMRGRFHPTDGQLYLCGMFAWAGNATYPGGLYRLRATGQPMHLPVGLRATKSGLKLTFTEPLDPASLDVKNLQLKTWSLQRTANYGSKHYDEKPLTVHAATLSADTKTLTLDVADLRPTWCMEIRYSLRSATSTPILGTIHNTIHDLGD